MPTKSYKSARVRGKKRVCVMLSADARLRRHVPPTRMLTLSSLTHMLRIYGSVYVKPDVGSLGIGICKVTAAAQGYVLRSIRNRKQSQRRFPTIRALYSAIKRNSGKRMIVQKAIALGTLRGRSYDMRMMVQRKPRGKWTVTGSFARIARSGKIVTNYSQGGRIWTIGRLFRAKGETASRIRARMSKLRRTALRTSGCLSRRQAGMHEIGVDFAYDGKGRLWILEVNTNHPQFHPMKRVNPSEYAVMMHYARSYGRYSAK